MYVAIRTTHATKNKTRRNEKANATDDMMHRNRLFIWSHLIRASRSGSIIVSLLASLMLLSSVDPVRLVDSTLVRDSATTSLSAVL